MISDFILRRYKIFEIYIFSEKARNQPFLNKLSKCLLNSSQLLSNLTPFKVSLPIPLSLQNRLPYDEMMVWISLTKDTVSIPFLFCQSEITRLPEMVVLMTLLFPVIMMTERYLKKITSRNRKLMHPKTFRITFGVFQIV